MKNLIQENQNRMFHLMIKFDAVAQVVKLVDTRDLKSLEGNFVPVQVRLWAPSSSLLPNMSMAQRYNKPKNIKIAAIKYHLLKNSNIFDKSG